MNRIHYGKQFIFDNSKPEVLKSLYSPTITQGANLIKFEKSIAKYLDVNHVSVCNSGTAGLHMAFHAINLKEGDNILMPSINFIAAYNMASLFKAKIHLIDVNKETGQICIDSVKNLLKKKKIKKVKAIISMYLGGYPENIIDLYKLKKKLGCYLIEDACHAFGSEYFFNKKKFKIGSCKHSDISVFSFHPLKTITTGEGGALTTKNKILNNRAKLFRSHGIIRNSNRHWSYNLEQIGFNYRLSEINCALGISQLNKINLIINKREKIKKLYVKELKKIKNYLDIPRHSKSISSNHLFVILLNFKKLKSSKQTFFYYMMRKKIYLQQHYIPIYHLKKIKYLKKEYQNSEHYYSRSVSLPIYYDLKKKDILRVVKEIKKFISLNK